MGEGAACGGCAKPGKLGEAPANQGEAKRIIAENDVAAFERLRGVPGHQLDPVPWARVVELVKENTEAAYGHLGRSPAALVVYHHFKLKVCSVNHGTASAECEQLEHSLGSTLCPTSPIPRSTLLE